MNRRSFLLFLAALCGVPLIAFAVFVAWMILTLGPMEMPPPPVKLYKTSPEDAHTGLAAALRKKWDIHLEETDRMLHATWSFGNDAYYYLLAPSQDFDYDSFREAITGEMKLVRRSASKYYVDDEEEVVGKGSGDLSWWDPPSLTEPDVVQIKVGTPDGPNARLWYFAISRKDDLIYIWHRGAEAVRTD